MRFTPKTDEEIARDNCWPAGEYDFEVTKAEDAVSKTSGAEMIHLKLLCYDQDGRQKIVDDYLMEKMAFKVKHFAQAVGLVDCYQQGLLTAEHCGSRNGRVLLIIQEDKSGKYPPKNAVKDYVPAGGSDKPQESDEDNGAPVDDKSDNLPF